MSSTVMSFAKGPRSKRCRNPSPLRSISGGTEPRRTPMLSAAIWIANSGESFGAPSAVGSSPGTSSLTIDTISPSAVTAARNSLRNTGMPFRRCSSVTHLKFPAGFA